MLKAWLGSRTPAPPERLAKRIEAAVGDLTSSGSKTIAEPLTSAAVAILAEMSGSEDATQARATALDLLAADALVTYAMEAASEDCASLTATADTTIARIAAVRANVDENTAD